MIIVDNIECNCDYVLQVESGLADVNKKAMNVCFKYVY